MENVPRETETIAAKRSLRLAEKIRNARGRITVTNSWWNTQGFEFLLLLIIFLFNVFSIYFYFGTATSSDTFFSGPIIPLMAKFFTIFKIPLSYAFQIVNIIFFVSFPFTLYFLIKEVTGRKIIAFMSILIASLPFYPFAQVRVLSALNGIDSAHVASLTITSLALLALFSFLKDGGAKNLFKSSLTASLIALISPFGFTTFLIFSVILTFSEMLLGGGRLKFFRFLSMLFFTGTLVAFWYNPSFSFWILTGDMGEEVRRTFTKLIPLSFFAIPAIAVFGYLLFDRKPSLQPVFLASFFTIAFILISFAGGGIFPSHPSRYIPELGISLSYLISVVLLKAYESLPFFKTHRPVAKVILTIMFLSLGLGIILGSSNLAPKEDVLGIWTGIEKGTLWREKERFNGISSAIGYLVSTASLFFLTFLYTKNSKQVSVTS